jgi:uncharacterized membrane protein YoaK (UPF0700 family)
MRDPAHGPLPGILIALTLVTGIVDAVSYLRFGHVFVANMTGNVVFLGFGLAGDRDVSVSASLISIAAFAAGAFGGGRLGSLLGAHRGRLIFAAVIIKVALVAAAVLIAVFAPALDASRQYLLIVLLALTMGLQNAVVRRIAVPDLTTTVLTLTITGLAADGAWGGARTAQSLRRLMSVAAMLIGAVIGGVMVYHFGVAAGLSCALAVLAGAGLYSWSRTRGTAAAWSAAR